MTLRLSLAQAAALGLCKAQTRTRRRDPTGADSPQARLQSLLTRHWPNSVLIEFTGAVPGRRFRLDAAFPLVRLGIEVDGWEYHGKHKGDFLRDRERDRQLVLHGWRLLRFAASEIRRNPWGVLDQVRQALGE